MGKVILGYITLQLIEENKIDLDTPIYKYYDYKDISHDNRHKKVTARMILSHQAGLPNWRRNRKEEKIKKLFFIHNPGEKFSYSGEGYVWLQKTIENILNKTFEQIAKERVFMPLKMNNSSFIWQERFNDNYAKPHKELGELKQMMKFREPNAAYSLLITAEDYAKFLLAIINSTGISKKK